MLKFIVIFLLVIYALGFIGRILLRHYLAKMASRFANGFQQNNHHQTKREGEVTVDVKPEQGKAYNRNIGEYVDFEEVK